jgi:hypothetical protein
MGIELIGPSLGALQAAGAVPTKVRKTVTFVAGTTGATGTHNLFTISSGGRAAFHLRALATTSLDDTTGATATISFGTTSRTNALSDEEVITADGWLADYWWEMTSQLFSDGVGSAYGADFMPSTHENVVYAIGGEAVTAGVAEFYLEYIPLLPGTTFTAA